MRYKSSETQPSGRTGRFVSIRREAQKERQRAAKLESLVVERDTNLLAKSMVAVTVEQSGDLTSPTGVPYCRGFTLNSAPVAGGSLMMGAALWLDMLAERFRGRAVEAALEQPPELATVVEGSL